MKAIGTVVLGVCLASDFVFAADFAAAKCVWAEGRLAETNLTVAFERTFDGTELKDPALRISASAVYRAYLNGTFIGWGPARTVNGFARIDEWPLRPQAGENTLRVVVAGYGFESFQYNGGSPFFAAEVLSGGKTVLATPDGFAATEVPRRADMPVYSRQRGFPAEWTVVGGPAGAKLPLAEVPAPKWLPRTVPYPDFSVNASFAAAKDAQGREMWRLPTVDSGFVGLKVRCAKPGRITVEFDEALGTNGVIDILRNGDPLKSWHAMYNRVTWEVAKPGEYALESMEPYTVQFARIVPESGEFADASIFLRRCRNARVAQSSFRCSDSDIEAMFAAAQESLAQNAVDIFTDCPSRERVGWLCDTFFSSETAAWLTGDFSIEREYLLNFTRTDEFGANIPKGAVPGFMPSRQGGLMPTYMMWYVIQCAAAAERLGGNERTAFAEGVRARVDGVFGWLGQFEKEGLLEDLPGWVFIEWSKANDYTKGVNFPANMLWAMALERAGRMLGRTDWIAKAADVRAKVRALAYDGMVFHDQALRGADGRLVLTAEAKTETCQYYAFFTSLVTPASHPDLWRTLVTELGPYRRGHDDMSPSDAFIGYLLRLNVLARYGCGRELIADMKAYYLRMAKSSGTYWEFGDGHDSRCHALGGYVAVLMLKEIFGIERIDWANRRLSLRNPSSGLAFADCRIPVADGTIRMSCRGSADKRTVELPSGWTLHAARPFRLPAKDTLDTNLTVAVCLDRVERTLLCGEPKEKANRNGILRTIGELERWIDPATGRFPKAPEWAKKGVRGSGEAQLANLTFAYARLLKHAGTAFGFPAYAVRGRTMEERIIRERGEAPDFRDEGTVPAKVRDYYALMEANRRELANTVRPGDVNGQPFWNENALLFIYPPSFPFARRDGASSYRFTVSDDVQNEHVLTAERPTAPLTPVWSELPVGFTTVRCEALDAEGNVLGCVGTRRFWRAAPFDPSEYAPAKRDYATARRMTLEHLLAWPEIAYLEEHGHPDISQGSNFTSYPSKMQSAVINMMLEIAATVPADRERALRIARIAGDYLLSVRERPGAPLEGFTATYVGQGQLSGTYSGQHMLVYPASGGAAFLRLFAATQDRKYLDAATLIGRTYLRLQGEDGTWYLKMNAKDGSPVSPNRLLPTSVLPFLESLYEATKDEAFRAAADRAFASIDKGPLVDWDWAGQFEDIAPTTKRYQNLTKHMACETALYLLKRFPGDRVRLAQAREILRFSEDQFVMWKAPCRPDGTGAWVPVYPFLVWRTPAVLEQYRCYSPIDASASKLIKTYLALYRAEGRPLDLAKAKALGDSMVNNQDEDGRIRTYWIPEPGDDDPLVAGAIRLPQGGDWFNCMASDVEALSELVSATENGN